MSVAADITGEVGVALGLRGATRKEQAAVAARHLTSVFMRQLIEQMWQTVPEGGLIPTSTGEKIFRDFMNEKLASDLSRSVRIPTPKSHSGEPLQNRAAGADTVKGGGADGYWMG